MSAPTKVRRIAGVALTPDTISGNRRLYRRSVVEQSVRDAQVRVRSGRFVMCSSHAGHAADDPRSLVARVVELRCDENGVARYVAELAPTAAADEVYALARDGYLACSIRGQWVGQLTTERGPDGLPVTHAPALQLLGIDATLSPGIEQATAQAVEQARDPQLVVESTSGPPVVIADGPVDLEHMSWFEREQHTAAAFEAAAEQVRADRAAVNAARWGGRS